MDRRSIIVALLVAVLPFTNAVAQSDRSGAEAAAASFLQRLDSGDLVSVYQAEMSPRFKTTAPELAFVQNIGMMRIQTGGQAASRRLVGAQALDQVVGIPDKGNFYYVRHHSRFPVGAVFQDVYLEKVSGSWKVIGFGSFPAPAQ